MYLFPVLMLIVSDWHTEAQYMKSDYSACDNKSKVPAFSVYVNFFSLCSNLFYSVLECKF